MIDGSEFESRFDSGSLAKAEENHTIFSNEKSRAFNLWVTEDNPNNVGEHDSVKPTSSGWFYFAVKKMKGCPKVEFNILNMCMNKTLFKNGKDNGLRPVWNQNFDPAMQKHDMDEWLPVNTCEVSKGKNDNFVLTFTHQFRGTEFNTTYFALYEPFTYHKHLKRLEYFEQKMTLSADILYHKELLCYSKENRRVDMLTITHPVNVPNRNNLLHAIR